MLVLPAATAGTAATAEHRHHHHHHHHRHRHNNDSNNNRQLRELEDYCKEERRNSHNASPNRMATGLVDNGTSTVGLLSSQKEVVGHRRLLDEVIPFVPSSEAMSIRRRTGEKTEFHVTAGESRFDCTRFTVGGKSFVYPFVVEWLASPGIIIEASQRRSVNSSVGAAGVGLVNRQNACFLNATIQALTYCPILLEDSLAQRHKTRCARAAQDLFCGFCEFEIHIGRQMMITDQDIINDNHNNKTDAGRSFLLPRFSNGRHHQHHHHHHHHHHHGNQSRSSAGVRGSGPREIQFYPAMVKDFLQQYKISIKRQHCAYEFFTLFLDWLKRYDLPPQLEIPFQRNRISQEQIFTTYLGQLFGSIVQIRKTCQVCGDITFRHEVVYDFVLATAKVYDALDAFQKYFRTESFTGPNCLDCDRCGQRRPFLWEKRLLVPPNVLVLCFRRASWNNCDFSTSGKSAWAGLKKDTRSIKMPTEKFDLSSVMRWTADSNDNDNNNSSGFDSIPNIYRPSSAVIHMGSPTSGHYINISRGRNDRWYLFDDESVSQISDKKAESLLDIAFLVLLARIDANGTSNDGISTSIFNAVPTPSRQEVVIFNDKNSSKTLQTLQPNKIDLPAQPPLDLLIGVTTTHRAPLPSKLSLPPLSYNGGQQQQHSPELDLTSTTSSSRSTSTGASSTRAGTSSPSTSSSSNIGDSVELSPTSTASSATVRRRRQVIGKRLKKLFLYARVLKHRLKKSERSSPTEFRSPPTEFRSPPTEFCPSPSVRIAAGKSCDQSSTDFTLPAHDESLYWETAAPDAVRAFETKTKRLAQLNAQVRLPISKRPMHDTDYDRGKLKKRRRPVHPNLVINKNLRAEFDLISRSHQHEAKARST